MIIPHWVLFLTFIIYKKTAQSQSPIKSALINEFSNCECGKYIKIGARIIGGEITKPHEYPWMIAILYDDRLHCGGALINDRYILTAAHCLNGTQKENLSVIFGLYDRLLFELRRRGGSSEEIANVIVHERYSNDELHDFNDIALIKLRHPVEFSENIKPICLPNKSGGNYSKKMAHIMGWGKISLNGGPSRFLKQAEVSIMSNEDCRKVEIVKKHIKDTMLCAYENEVDACQGDSGGPLIFKKKPGKYEQIGVVSWGIGCAEPGMPGVYTRVTSYLDWIARHTKDGIYCKR